MKKILFFAVMAVVLDSCDANKPEQDPALLGQWKSYMSITFYDDNTLYYEDKPEPDESGVVLTYGGDYATLNYSAKENTLYISGERDGWDESIHKIIKEPFSFSTGYRIEGNTLTIDSFSYDGGNSIFIKPLILHKE